MTSRWLATGVLTAAGLWAMPASAQAGISVALALGWHEHERCGTQRDAYRAGFDRGYHDGLDRGKNDGQDRRTYDVWRHGRYRDGDHGFERRFGPRPAYVAGYRRGFERGYHENFVLAAHYHPHHDGYCTFEERIDRGPDRERRDDRRGSDRELREDDD